jgi:hypothetical protein
LYRERGTDQHLQRLAPLVQVCGDQDGIDRKVLDLLVQDHLVVHPLFIVLESLEQIIKLFLRMPRRFIRLDGLSQVSLSVDKEDPGGRHDLLEIIDRLGPGNGLLVTADDGQFRRSIDLPHGVSYRNRRSDRTPCLLQSRSFLQQGLHISSLCFLSHPLESLLYASAQLGPLLVGTETLKSVGRRIGTQQTAQSVEVPFQEVSAFGSSRYIGFDLVDRGETKAAGRHVRR